MWAKNSPKKYRKYIYLLSRYKYTHVYSKLIRSFLLQFSHLLSTFHRNKTKAMDKNGKFTDFFCLFIFRWLRSIQYTYISRELTSNSHPIESNLLRNVYNNKCQCVCVVEFKVFRVLYFNAHFSVWIRVFLCCLLCIYTNLYTQSLAHT